MLALQYLLASLASSIRKAPRGGQIEWPTCPYNFKYDGDTMEFVGLQIELQRGGNMSFECHMKSTGMGNTCPELQQARLKAARTFQEANYRDFVKRAQQFPLKPLFDKSDKVFGLESYEEMVQLQVQGLMHKDSVYIEDKILLKQLLNEHAIPATTAYFGAHKDEWNITKFKRMLGGLCLKGVDRFMIKAVHLAWSKGQRIVRGWQTDCPYEDLTNRKIEELANFVDREIMNVIASEADQHLRMIQPGVIVEELFKTGGHSKRPLEAKVQTLWGKVALMTFIGEDPRGCVSQDPAWHYFRDGTGWDLKGMLGSTAGNDEVSDLVLSSAFDGMVENAEKFATVVGADSMRVDFFVGFRPDGSVDYKVNEVESISGARYWHERDGLGRAWVDGYVLSDRMKMTSAKWDQITSLAESARANNKLD